MAITKVDGQTITAGAAGALTRAGGNTTEATTTSTSEVDLITVSSLSIAAGAPIYIKHGYRKTAGAASAFGAGLKINATAIMAALIVSNTSTTDQAEDGYMDWEIGPRVTNYQAALFWRWMCRLSTTGSYQTLSAGSTANMAAIIPIATITDVILTGKVGNASLTGGVDEVHIYTYAVS